MKRCWFSSVLMLAIVTPAGTRSLAQESAASARTAPTQMPSSPMPFHERRIVIVTSDESDGRLAATREAIAFWNATLSELTVPERFVETEMLATSPLARALEAYTRQIWLLAGRPVPTDGHPKRPAELEALDGDVVVFFSRQRIFSFAWPNQDRTRFFVGISTDTAAPLTYPNVTRNIVAHELGHTLGLDHNGRTPTLMCGPCESLLYRSEQPVFFPLTADDVTRLRTLRQTQ
jgi:hypothetical protein